MRVRFPWVATLTLIPVAIACAWLGTWQWHRMVEKQNLFDEFEQAPEQGYPAALESESTYLRVRLSGRYESGWHLLRDNRMEQGRPGVEVYSLFRPDHGTALLVNRGWLPMPPDRRQVPEVPTPEQSIELAGLLSPPPESGFRLGEPTPLGSLNGPVLVTYLDLPSLEAVLDDPLPHRVLLLDATDRTGFGARDWEPAVMRPVQHRAYAVQWFALAAAALIIWFTRVLRRSRSEGESQ